MIEKQPKTNKIAFSIIGVLLIVGVVALYFTEWVEIETDLGFSNAALRNPYLAAEKFLKEFEIESQVITNSKLFQQLPPVDEVLLFAGARRGMPATKVSELLEWVEAGGRLVVLARNYWDDEEARSGDGLLDTLQVKLYSTKQNNDSLQIFRQLEEFVGLDDDFCEDFGDLIRVQTTVQKKVRTKQSVIEVATSKFNYLVFEDADAWAQNSLGAQILRLPRGLGEIVVMTSFDMWRNYGIGCYDNAHLLRLFSQDSARVWWLFHAQMPSLFALLWEHYAYALLLLLTFMAFWIWWSGFRVNQLASGDRLPRRELMEHVRGTAKFLWQQKRGDRLLQTMREEVLQGSKPLSSFLKELSERSGLSEDKVIWAMSNRVRHDTEDFIQATKILQKLREVR